MMNNDSDERRAITLHKNDNERENSKVDRHTSNINRTDGSTEVAADNWAVDEECGAEEAAVEEDRTDGGGDAVEETGGVTEDDMIPTLNTSIRITECAFTVTIIGAATVPPTSNVLFHITPFGSMLTVLCGG